MMGDFMGVRELMRTSLLASGLLAAMLLAACTQKTSQLKSKRAPALSYSFLPGQEAYTLTSALTSSFSIQFPDSPLVGDPSDTSVVSIEKAPKLGELVLLDKNQGSFSYRPKPRMTGTDEIMLRIRRPKSGTNYLRLKLHVPEKIWSENFPPLAIEKSLALVQGETKVLRLSAEDLNGDELTYSIASPPPPQAGSIELLQQLDAEKDGVELRYKTDAATVPGNYTFSYRVMDRGFESLAAVRVQVRAPNRAPTITESVSLGLLAGTEKAGALKASDPDGDEVMYVITRHPQQGSVSLVDAHVGNFLYRAHVDAVGADTFRYRIVDEFGASSAEAEASIAFQVPPPVQAMAANYEIPQDQILEKTLVAQGSHRIVYSVIQSPFKGTVVVNPETGLFTYTPFAGARGTDSFRFKAVTAHGESGPANIQIHILGSNRAPVAHALELQTEANDPRSGDFSGSDPDYDTLTYEIVSRPIKGSVELSAVANPTTANQSPTRRFRYIPPPNYSGTVEFTYRVRDSGGLVSAPAKVTILIKPPVQTLMAMSLQLSIQLGASDLIDFPATTEEAVLFEILEHPRKGTAVLNQNTGELRYQAPSTIAALGGDPHDSLIYRYRRVRDNALSNSAEVQFTILTNDASLVALTPEEPFMTVSNTEIGRQLEGTGPIQRLIRFQLARPATLGTVVVNPDGYFTYLPRPGIPATGASQEDRFSFTVTDGTRTSASAEVRVIIQKPRAYDFMLEAKMDFFVPGSPADDYITFEPHEVLPGAAEAEGLVVDFGEQFQSIRGPRTAPFRIRNLGTNPLTISNIQLPDYFQLVDPIATTIPARAANSMAHLETFSVRLKADRIVDLATGELVFQVNYGSGGESRTVVIPLMGSILPRPAQ